MIFNSIRWRVQAWHSVILVLVLAGFGFTAYHVARDNQLRRVDQELEQHFILLFRPQPMDSPPAALRHGGPPDPAEILAHIRGAIQRAARFDATQANSFYHILWSTNGNVAARSPGSPMDVPYPQLARSPAADFSNAGEANVATPPAPARPFPGQPSLARTRKEFREVVHVGPFDDRLLVGRSMAADLASMRRLAFWLVIAGAAVLGLGLAGGWWVASRAIRPIEDISATAAKIAAGDLSQRISLTDTENELGHLAGVLNSTFARLESAFNNQARFTSDASHELRTPVSTILLQTQTALSRERPSSEYQETLEACQRAAQRMRQLIESLLALARLDAGQELLRRDECDLSAIVGRSIELIRPLATHRGITIQTTLSKALCRGDATRLAQVSDNLLTNAVNYNQEGGEIRISTANAQGMVTLIVTNTGAGIAAEDLPHIFERFYRADKARTSNGGHSGLGLAITKAIVQAHGGAITARSEPGSRTTFTVSLPV
jgi:heavy metal sensor kinase